MTISRRDFTRTLLAGVPAVAFAPSWRVESTAEAKHAVPSLPAASDEPYWEEVRAQFLVPRDLVPLNAANLCPASRPVLDRLYELTRDIDRDPSPHNREKFRDGKETARKIIAAYLRVQPEEIVITRNTSEANNLVSSGLELGPGDEVVIFDDNHPSNHAAWTQKAARYGFDVTIVPVRTPYPGPDYYVHEFQRHLTARTRVLAFTHVTNTVGDVLPAKELCRLARERGVLTLVDGAQSFGVLDVDLSDMQPDFFTGSAHKWPCGPRETGVLYVSRAAHDRIAASVVSLYAGAVGISQRLEAMGQRDEPAMVAFGDALQFQTKIGMATIEKRSRELAQALMDELPRVAGVTLWTNPDPAASAAVVVCKPAGLDPRRLADALYRNDGVVCAVRSGDRPGVRFSPHFYNLRAEIERTVAAVEKYVARGV